MANLIKKIKIKKQDGTFSDYIPIGAEAENVNVDGESVKVKLAKKPYYYDTVADMKADAKLKVGDMAITLGYYEPNDGGSGQYNITNIRNINKYQENLNNGLYANLIVENEINVECFGAIGDGIINDTDAIINCFKYSKKIIANKIYKCNFSDIEISNDFILIGNGTFKLNKIIFNGKVNINNINFIFDDTTSLGITLNGNNSIIKSCIFNNLNLNAKTSLLSIKANNIIVKDSSFINNQSGRAGIMANTVDNCVVKNCYFEKIGETAVTFMGSSKNCIADSNIAKDCAILGTLSDGVFSTYADFDSGIYADNIGFINNQILGNDIKYCFRFDGILNGYAKNNFINISGDCKRVFRIQDRIDHEIKLYTKNIDISDNVVNVNSTSTVSIVAISSAHDGLFVNISNNLIKAFKENYTSIFIEMAQDTSFNGKIIINNNDVDINGYIINYNSDAATLVNYDMLNNKFYYHGRVVFSTSGRINVINNYFENDTNHMIQLKNCKCIIINNTLVNSTQVPDIYNVTSSATMLTPLDNTLIQIS